MKYISTRSYIGEFSFFDVLLGGYAPDGGLFVPSEIPVFSEKELLSFEWLPFAELAYHVIRPFIGDEMPSSELKKLVSSVYGQFGSKAVAPLYQTDSNEWILELFHGPAGVYQDFGLQFMARLIEYYHRSHSERVSIIGCTGGDTGAAAIAAFNDMSNVELVVVHPSVGIDQASRARMLQMAGSNVLNISVAGNYADCHKLCEQLLCAQGGKKWISFNSINWVRIVAQLPFYFYSALQLGAPRRGVAFSVPTGNFGALYAAYLVKMMGVSISQLLVVTNRNAGLHRFMSSNAYGKSEISETNTPSMNVSVASNFERFVWSILKHDGQQVARTMGLLEKNEVVKVNVNVWLEVRKLFDSLSVEDSHTLETAQALKEQNGYGVSRNTAAGVYAARIKRRSLLIPMVCLATTKSQADNEAPSRSSNVVISDAAGYQLIANNYNELDALLSGWASS